MVQNNASTVIDKRLLTLIHGQRKNICSWFHIECVQKKVYEHRHLRFSIMNLGDDLLIVFS